MTETKTQGISARQLLEGARASFKNAGKEINLSPPAMSEIANDSDYHRTRIGYSRYESAVLVKNWAIALGIACGDYPARSYNCDIAAIPISPEGKTDEAIAKEIREALENGGYFHNSLVYATADGNLAVSKNGKFIQKTLELLRPKIKDFIARDLEIEPNYINLDLRPVVKSPVKYKPEFIAFLSDAFRTILSDA